MSESIIIVSEAAKGVATLQINRPDVLNALNTQVLSTLSQELQRIEADPEVRVVILTGNTRAFAAGADIGELQKATTGDFPEEERQRAWKNLRDFPKPIIAAVSGFALGGGCELMMVADIVVASRSAQFGQPEVNLGVMPGAGGTQRLTRLIGKSAAMKMNLTGDFINAEEALRLGLITEVAEPELYLQRATEIAIKIASKSSTAVRAIKAAILDAYQSNLEQGLTNERATFLKTVVSEDAAEGIAAYIEKRSANFPSNRS